MLEQTFKLMPDKKKHVDKKVSELLMENGTRVFGKNVSLMQKAVFVEMENG